MKIFAFIMAFLVLGLSCLACADNDIAMNDNEGRIELIKQHDQQESNDHDDYCSPFCHCTCCTSFSFNHPVAETGSFFTGHPAQYSSHYIVSIVEISLPIWQPPQLA